MLPAKQGKPDAMAWQIKASAQLLPADIQAIKALSAATYPPGRTATNPKLPKEWARPQWHALLWDEDGRLLTFVGALTTSVRCDGQPAFIGGIGGVKTHPAWRRRGHASAGIQLAIDFLRDEQAVDFTLLVCRQELIAWYQRFGFVHFTGDTMARQAGASELFTWNETMLLPGKTPTPRCQTLDLCGPPW